MTGKKRRSFLLLGLTGLGLLLYKTGSFLFTDSLAGRDLVGAYSLVKIFPEAWTSSWFLGYPPFSFYPPGFFGLTATLGQFTGELLAFKLVVFSMLLVFPPLVFHVFSGMFDERTGLIAGLMALLVVFLREPFSLVYQTLQVGLVAQMAGLLALVAFIGLLWKDDRGSIYLAAVLAGLLPLLHPFVAFLGGLYVLIYAAASKNIYRAFMASLGFGLSAWWWIPVIERSWYLNPFTGPSGLIANLPWLFIPFLVVERCRKQLSLAFFSLLLLLVGIIDFSFLPVQSYRFFIYGQIFAVLAAAPGIKKLVEKMDDKVDARLLVVLVGLSVLIPASTQDIEPHWESDISLDNIDPGNGRFIAETSNADIFTSYVPQQTLPLHSNASAVNGLYADSSVSSPYLLGLEKAVAADPLSNPIALTENLSSQQIERRMDYFDIRYALVRTLEARQNLDFMSQTASNPDLVLLEHDPLFNRTVENAITVSGPRRDWEELNHYIFRNELVTNIIYLHDEDGHHRLQDHSPEEIVELAKNSTTGRTVTLGRQSIKPSAEREAVFGLRLKD